MINNFFSDGLIFNKNKCGLKSKKNGIKTILSIVAFSFTNYIILIGIKINSLINYLMILNNQLKWL